MVVTAPVSVEPVSVELVSVAPDVGVDEAAQAIEASSLIPLRYGAQQVVLATGSIE